MRRRAFPLSLAVLACSLPLPAASTLRKPAASMAADFDSKSFLVGGRRVLLRCGGLHYFRIPPPEWADRLLQTRLAGFNAVETPILWSLHQPTRDAWVTEGVADVGRFLDLCHEQGLMAFVRVGPYVNATVTNGGLPAWLGHNPRLRVRSTDKLFLEAVSGYWRKLLPLLVRRQAPKGPVVLVQIEDHYDGQQRGYLTKLYDEAVAAGIRVPVVLSELHPCRTFQRLRVSDDTFFATTEFVPAEPLPWGQPRRPFPRFDDALLEGLGRGIDGYNHPLWTAGTHFAVLPASSFPTRFEAATSGLLEGGGLSPIAHGMKRVNHFLRAFEPVLANATAASHPLLDQARRAAMVAYGRTDGTTTILILKRPYGDRPYTLRDEATGIEVELVVSAGLFGHLVVNYPLTPKTTLALSVAQILTIQKLRDRLLLAVHITEGYGACMAFKTPGPPQIIAGQEAATWDPARKQLLLAWKQTPARGVTDFIFQADERIHVVAIPTERVERTWVLDGAGLLIGAPGVGPWTTGASLDVELRVPVKRAKHDIRFYPFGPQQAVEKAKAIGSSAWSQEARCIRFAADIEATPPSPILLRNWQMGDATAEAASGFDDSAWPDTQRPEPLGEAPYGWYRCRFDVPRPGAGKLVFDNVADTITVFLNGRYVGQSPTKRLMDAPRTFRNPVAFDVQPAKGDNLLAVLVKNWGRYRNTTSFDKPLAQASAWGILGSVLLDGRPGGRWRRHEGMSPAGRPLRWGGVTKTQCPVRWYRATFRVRKGEARLVARARLKGLGYGAAWLNGRFLGLYQKQGYDAGHGLYLPGAWLEADNELIALEEDGREPELSEVRIDRPASCIPLRVTFR